MDIRTGRVNHIEDVLVNLHLGAWFGWTYPSGSKDKLYENLILHPVVNGVEVNYEKPTQEFLESELQSMQEEFDGITYQRNRVDGVSGSYAASQGTGSIYPSTGEQLDMLYHELETSGSLTISGSWFNTVKTVKDANPKP